MWWKSLLLVSTLLLCACEQGDNTQSGQKTASSPAGTSAKKATATGKKASRFPSLGVADPGTAFLLPRDRLDETTRIGVDNPELRQDLVFLRHMLEEGHPVYNLRLEGSSGWDAAWKKLLRRYPGRGATRTSEFLDHFQEVLTRHIPDGGIVIQSWKGEGNLKASISVGQPLYLLDVELLQDGKSYRLPEHAAASSEMIGAVLDGCAGIREEPVGVRVWDHRIQRTIWKLSWRNPVPERVECTFVLGNGTRRVVQYGTHARKQGGEVGGFESSALVQVVSPASDLLNISKNKALVVDLRSDAARPPGAWSNALGGYTREDIKPWSVASLESALTVQGDVNRELVKVDDFEKRFPDTTKRDLTREKVLFEDLGKAQWGLKQWVGRAEEKKMSRRSPRVEGNGAALAEDRWIVLLVNETCDALCRHGVHLWKQVGEKVLVVGSEVGPAPSFGEVGLYRLPGSRLEVRLPQQAFVDEEAHQGLSPDIWLDTIHPAREAIALAATLQKKLNSERSNPAP